MRRRLVLSALGMAALVAAAPRAWAQGEDQIDGLLTALKSAPDAETAAMIEKRLQLLWIQAGSPAAALLLERGSRDIGNNAEHDALRALDAALVIDPNYAWAYAERATARLLLGDAGGAVADVEAALKHDARLFYVFATLSRIAQAQGNWQSAYAAWQRFADADPHGAGVAKRLRELETKAVGVKS